MYDIRIYVCTARDMSRTKNMPTSNGTVTQKLSMNAKVFPIIIVVRERFSNVVIIMNDKFIALKTHQQMMSIVEAYNVAILYCWLKLTVQTTHSNVRVSDIGNRNNSFFQYSYPYFFQ